MVQSSMFSGRVSGTTFSHIQPFVGVENCCDGGGVLLPKVTCVVHSACCVAMRVRVWAGATVPFGMVMLLVLETESLEWEWKSSLSRPSPLNTSTIFSERLRLACTD